MKIPAGFALRFMAAVLAAPVAATAQTAIKAGSLVNVRSGPGTGYASLGMIPAGQVYVAASKSGDWWKIWFDGRSGYTHAAYWTGVAGQSGVKVTADAVNVRTGAGTSFASVGRASMGSIYYWTSVSGGWYRINWGGASRWINSAYVTRVSLSGGSTTTTTTTTTTTSSITNLNMEYAKQVTGYFCGPATVQMVAKYCAGSWISQWTLSSYMGTSSWSGTDVGALGRGLRRYANSGYLTATYFNRDRVVKSIGQKFPVAINIQCRYLAYWGYQYAMHYSPIKGYTSGGFYIHDSWLGPNKWASSTEVKNAVNYHTAYYYPRY